MAHGAARVGALVALLATGAFLISDNTAFAQQGARARLSQIERDRTAANAEAQRLRSRAAATQTEIDALNQRLVNAAHRRAAAEAAMAESEQRLAELRREADVESARAAHSSDAFAAAVIAAAFAQRRVELRAQRAGVFAAAVAPAFQSDFAASTSALARNRQRNAEIAQQEAALADAQRAIDAERADVTALLAQRRALQTTLASNADAAEHRAQQLAREARSLRELAQRVAPRGRRPSNGADVVPAAWIAPASGVVVHSFGASVQGAPAAQGATLRTHAGAQIVAPAAGRVAYAGLFRSYGQVLILNVDGGYAVVLTGLGAVRARVGDTVVPGQPVGEMPGSATAAPELYVEVRRDGRPIDPARWLSAQGLASEPSGASPG